MGEIAGQIPTHMVVPTHLTGTCRHLPRFTIYGVGTYDGVWSGPVISSPSPYILLSLNSGKTLTRAAIDFRRPLVQMVDVAFEVRRPSAEADTRCKWLVLVAGHRAA